MLLCCEYFAYFITKTSFTDNIARNVKMKSIFIDLDISEAQTETKSKQHHHSVHTLGHSAQELHGKRERILQDR